MERIAVKHFEFKEFQSQEAIKTLRTNLLFCGEGTRVVALTSFGAAEGKSTIAFQLAASLAHAGKRVLLMDTDLRKSLLAKRLRVRNKVVGLSHFLSGMAELEETLCETDVDGMYIMFAGVRVANSAELLGSVQFQKMIQVLRESFDYVIIDAAPLGQVVDCAVMAPNLDGVMLVVDTTNNSYKLIRRMKQQLEKTGGKVLGVVLNRVDFRDKGSYYGKAYGYGGYAYDDNSRSI